MEGDAPKPLSDQLAKPLPPSGRSYTFLIVVTAISLVLDLGSKWWAKERFEDARAGDRTEKVIEGFMNFTFARNKGGAWGILQNEDETIRRAFFLTISVVAIVFIVSLYRKLQPGQRALKWGLPLVLGGALGNLIDRIRYGWVVDFIDCYWGSSHWPTFNVADIAICVGVGLMAIDMFGSRKRRLAEEHPPDSAPRSVPTSAPLSEREPASVPADPPAKDAG